MLGACDPTRQKWLVYQYHQSPENFIPENLWFSNSPENKIFWCLVQAHQSQENFNKDPSINEFINFLEGDFDFSSNPLWGPVPLAKRRNGPHQGCEGRSKSRRAGPSWADPLIRINNYWRHSYLRRFWNLFESLGQGRASARPGPRDSKGFQNLGMCGSFI